MIRLLRYVRDTTYGLNIKSVILTTLVGQRIGELKPMLSPGCDADLPTTLKTVIDDLDDYLEQNYFLPTIVDPGGSGDYFDERWDQEGYAASAPGSTRCARRSTPPSTPRAPTRASRRGRPCSAPP